MKRDKTDAKTTEVTSTDWMTLSSLRSLLAGSWHLAEGIAGAAYDGGGLGKGGKGTLTVDGNKVGEDRIEQTSPVWKFSLDEGFEAGQDTGTPVIDEYDAKMPFKFTGTLNNVEIELGASQLTPRQQGELRARQ